MPRVLVRLVDPLVVVLIRAIVQLGELKSRNFTEDPTRALRPDKLIQSRLRSWRAMLDWPAERRVGCFVGVMVGIVAGGAFLWYQLSAS